MEFKVRRPAYNSDNKIELVNGVLEDIVVAQDAVLVIDGSTSNSGLAIMRESDGALLYSISASRDSNRQNETPVRYKIQLKRHVEDILRRNKYISQIYYEEPVIANVSAVSNLFMLRTFIEEMIIENEPEFNYLKHFEINNMRWKHLFLSPEKVPQGTENQKRVVRERLEKYLPFLNTVTQDEIDAIAMGFVVCTSLKGNSGVDVQDLASKKKTRPFKFEVDFIGADNDDDAFTEFIESYPGPKKLMDNRVNFVELGSREDFKKKVYESMGDEDIILLIKFSSNKHGNTILEYKLGRLSVNYEYIYAVVWRTTRKH